MTPLLVDFCRDKHEFSQPRYAQNKIYRSEEVRNMTEILEQALFYCPEHDLEKHQPPLHQVLAWLSVAPHHIGRSLTDIENS